MNAPAIPGFTFVQPLGSGGFADVLLYEQEWPRQRVAVKVVRPDVVFTDREKALFRSEADAMARLADHPYIVDVLTAGETADGRPFLVMRYCPPPDLGQRVRTKPMSVADALSTGVKLASAVETAHRSGILHRDIKPSNVLVTTYSEPALTDFGIAGRIAEVHADTEVRMSYPWAPPELIEGRSNGTVASDVYSLGATIWNLLVGRSPFAVPHGDNGSRALATRILHAPPPPTQRPDVPAALDRLLQQCLAKNPTHRPQSAMDLARELQRIESSLGYARTPVAVEDTGGYAGPVRDDTDPDVTRLKPSVVHASVADAVAAPEPARTSRAGLVWAGVGVLAALALLVVVLVRSGEEPQEPPLPTTASQTPSDPIVDVAPAPPQVSVERTDQGYRFTWAPVDEPQEGDSYYWVDPDTGQEARTSDTSVVRPGRCLQVRLVRGGTLSAVTLSCAEA